MRLRLYPLFLLATSATVTVTVNAISKAAGRCSVHSDFCGVYHERVFYQYRDCCEGLKCGRYDRLGEVSDVVSPFHSC
ncbi:hypothetical protein C8F01DRAFT_1145136 [Mycena amicta]|nr:hypothetical protein C8F01DRAFT_1145136 [Mycena amicta]